MGSYGSERIHAGEKSRAEVSALEIWKADRRRTFWPKREWGSWENHYSQGETTGPNPFYELQNGSIISFYLALRKRCEL